MEAPRKDGGPGQLAGAGVAGRLIGFGFARRVIGHRAGGMDKETAAAAPAAMREAVHRLHNSIEDAVTLRTADIFSTARGTSQRSIVLAAGHAITLFAELSIVYTSATKHLRCQGMKFLPFRW
jgi:hypothetical protein